MTLCAHFSPNNNKKRGKYLQYATVCVCKTQNSGIENKRSELSSKKERVSVHFDTHCQICTQ